MNIVDLITQRANGESPAIWSEGKCVTFGDLLVRAEKVSDWLTGQDGWDEARRPRIGLACANGVDYIVLALGILKAGGCLVPLADELTQAERQEVMERTHLQGMITQVGDEPQWTRLEAEEFEYEADFIRLNPAFIRFSSGTTGRSKGVVLSHEKLLERITAANAALQIGSRDRVLWMLPMAHHFAVSIILYLYHGACTVLGSSHLAADVLNLAEETRATVIYGSPFHHSLLAADTTGYPWPDLRLAVSTAAPLPVSTAENFKKRFQKPLVQGLGIIEIGLPLLNTGGAEDSPAAVGRPLPAFDVELRNEEGVPVTHGKTGELWIKGPGMFDAYLSPWQTADEVCVKGWFATGDLAETDAAGRVYLKGRKKSVMNIGGMKVFPEEVEAVINGHPAVKRSRVYGLDHAIFGTIPIAEVIVDQEVSVSELHRWCLNVLSTYKVPVRMKFVDELPLTASGKIRRV